LNPKIPSLIVLVMGLTVMAAHSAPRAYADCNKPRTSLSREEADIFVEVNGKLSLNGQPITVRTLKVYAADWRKETALPVVVAGRMGTPFSKIAYVISTLRAAGVKNIACEAPHP
jgi:biopolymer transport protein ExbD